MLESSASTVQAATPSIVPGAHSRSLLRKLSAAKLNAQGIDPITRSEQQQQQPQEQQQMHNQQLEEEAALIPAQDNIQNSIETVAVVDTSVSVPGA